MVDQSFIPKDATEEVVIIHLIFPTPRPIPIKFFENQWKFASVSV